MGAVNPAHLAQILRDHRRWMFATPGGERYETTNLSGRANKFEDSKLAYDVIIRSDIAQKRLLPDGSVVWSCNFYGTRWL